MKNFVLLFLLFSQSCTLYGKELRIAYSDLVRPFLYIEDNELKGIDLDIMNSVAKQLDLNVSYIHMPWDIALSNVKKGKIAAVLSAYCKQPRDGLLVSSEETYKTNISVFALTENNYSLKDLHAHSSNKMISVVRGNYYIPLMSKYTSLTKVELPDIFAQGYQLLKGNVAFSVSEEAWFLEQMASRNALDKVEIIDVLDSTSVCLAFSSDRFSERPDFIQRVDDVLATLKHQGEIQAFFNNHTSTSYLNRG